MSDPGSFPGTHDLRKVVLSYAFFRTMSVVDISGVPGWSSCRVFEKHYMFRIKEVGSSFLTLGYRGP